MSATVTPLKKTPQFGSELKAEMDFEIIRYSQVWEDSQLLKEAVISSVFAHNPEHFVSIGSAGCNVFSLMLLNPQRISIIDLSPAQLALIRLKWTAIQNLDTPDEFRSLLQGGACALKIYEEKIKDNLDSQTAAFFEHHKKEIEKGIAQSGRLEQYFQLFRKNVLIPALGGDSVVEKLLASKNLAEQLALYEKADLEYLRTESRKYFSQAALEKQGRDPAQFKYVKIKDVGDFFLQKFDATMRRSWIGENPYLMFFIAAKVGNLPFLEVEQFAALKRSKTQLYFHLGDLEGFLQDPVTPPIDFANLSDIFEYVSESHAELLLDHLLYRMKPQGRIAYWNCLVERRPQNKNWLRESDLSALCTQKDRAWFYLDFNVYKKS